jgi:hypothetical protein
MMLGLFLISLAASEQMQRRNLSANIYSISSGNNIRQNISNMTQYRSGLMNISLNCGKCNLSINGSIIRARLSNGKNFNVKIIPENASKIALKKLRLRNCNETNNCSIELKEVGKNNNTKLAYEMQVQRHYKLLGMFKKRAQNKVQIDSETGEIISQGKPWWRFLAKEITEEIEDEDNNGVDEVENETE